MVKPDYQHIWDCCCDHGFLGAKLLSNQTADNIHFVEIVPELITNIENKLQQFYSHPKSNWKTHCLDVAELTLDDYAGKHLIIIAGVGGDLTSRMVDAIHQTHQHVDIDFLLCPANRQFSLRKKLIALEFSLYDEILIEDKQRFYEILYVSSTAKENLKITAIGEKIWNAVSDSETQVAQDYLNKTLNYYQKVQQGNVSNVEHIINAYQTVKV